VASTDERSVLEGKLKIALVGCLLLACAPFVRSQSRELLTLDEAKRWHFNIQNHEIDVSLFKPDKVNHNTTLSLKVHDRFKPTASEEANLLRQVLREMPSLGYDPKNLGRINTWLQQSEFLEGVEDAVSKSGIWKSCTGHMYCYQAQGVADQFLSSVDAFKEFDAVLHEYGLRGNTIHVDGMGVGMKDGQILCSGLIIIYLEKEK